MPIHSRRPVRTSREVIRERQERSLVLSCPRSAVCCFTKTTSHPSATFSAGNILSAEAVRSASSPLTFGAIRMVRTSPSAELSELHSTFDSGSIISVRYSVSSEDLLHCPPTTEWSTAFRTTWQGPSGSLIRWKNFADHYCRPQAGARPLRPKGQAEARQPLDQPALQAIS